MPESDTEYGDAGVTAEQYNYVIGRICEILKVDRKDRLFYRKAIAEYGEDHMMEILGWCMVYIKEDRWRECFEDRIRGRKVFKR